MKRSIATLIVALAALMLFAACSSAPEPVDIEIDMSEFAFEPNAIELQVGQEVTFHLVNNGTLVHEIMIGRDVMMMDEHPAGYQVDFFENAGVEPTVAGDMVMEDEEEEMHSGFMLPVPEGGGSSTMTFTVTEDMVGEWEIGCFEQEGTHYTAGMKGTLVVNP